MKPSRWVEVERGLDARNVKHGACESVGHGVDATAPPACAEIARLNQILSMTSTSTSKNLASDSMPTLSAGLVYHRAATFGSC